MRKKTTEAAKMAAMLLAAKAKVAVVKAVSPFLLKAGAIILLVGLLVLFSWGFVYIVIGAFFPMMAAGLEELNPELEAGVGEIVCTPTKKITAKELDKKIDQSGARAFKGKGSAFLSAGEKYGVDPILVMAIAMRDVGPGKKHNNPGNLYNHKTKEILKFDSMEEGIEKMTSNIYRNYIVDGMTTPKQMEKKYAPKGAPNYNPHWASSVEAQIEQLGGLTYTCERVIGGSESVQAMINEAHTLIGKTKYVFGGNSFPNALDCSSFTMQLYKRHLGINLPRTTGEQVKVGKKIKKSELAPGDLVFFKNTYRKGVSHVGIYIGDNKFIHAANSKDDVIVTDLNDKYYKDKWHSARRVNVAAKHTDGKLVRPVNTKRISCKFKCYKGHNGIDLPAPIDTPVFAADSGKVVKVRHLEGSYGSYIVIDHGGGLKTLYAHMYPYQVKVKVGDKVKRGQVIGAVGNKGRSTGPHLHFEVSLHGEYVNPEKYIK